MGQFIADAALMGVYAVIAGLVCAVVAVIFALLLSALFQGQPARRLAGIAAAILPVAVALYAGMALVEEITRDTVHRQRFGFPVEGAALIGIATLVLITTAWFLGRRWSEAVLTRRR